MFKTLTTVTKVMIGITAALAAATTAFVLKDKKALKAANAECDCCECDCTDATEEAVESDED